MPYKKKRPASTRGGEPTRGRLIAAMSGGVDSSIAAALLKKQGHEVIGLFFNMHKNCNPKDAKKVAKKLGIPLRILDVRKEFKKKVIDYFINEYKKGRTPNPCVECNRFIKFSFLLKKMMEFKADYVATGHYARIQWNLKLKIKNLKLLTAKDKTKDQSYFLWTLNQKQLAKIIFPIGDYTKLQVRQMAKKFGLQIHDKRDSQEICFVTTTVQDFLRKNLPAEALAKAGPVFTVDGKKIGEHEGLAFYTIGQRKGIKIGGIGPFYVVDKDFKKNALIVAQSDFNEALYKKEMTVKNVNWINKVNLSLRCRVKIRYLTEAVPCIVMNHESRIKNYVKVVFNKSQRAITPGQSAVFYKNNELLGGGIIC